MLPLLCAAALAACSDGESEAPLPETIAIESGPEFADRALALASDALASHGITAALAAPGQTPHVTVGSQVDDASVAVNLEPLVVVTRLGATPEALTAEEVTALDLAELAPDEIESWLASDEALAFLPLGEVDARMQVVPVDGIDLVFGEGDVSAYPLGESVWVSAAEQDDPDLALILQQTKTAIAEGLAADYERPDPIILRATGDILPVRCAHAKQLEYGDLAHAFRELGPWLSEADITVGSLDAAISDAGVPFECVETFSLLAPAASVEGLAVSGFDVITVATNHVKDCGQNACGDEAFFDTLDNLRANGIEPVGGGADLEEARAPEVLEVDGTTFAFLGADQIASYYHAEPGVPGTGPLTEEYLREDVAAAAAIADVVVVLPQWGVEYTHDPNEIQQSLADVALEAGATLVIGNHPHWVQAVEPGDGTFVAYALGNFVFDQDWSIPTQQGVVLDVAFHGSELKGILLHPVRIIEEHQPVFAAPTEAQEILNNIWSASERLP